MTIYTSDPSAHKTTREQTLTHQADPLPLSPDGGLNALLALATERSIGEGTLDEAVHDTVAAQASSVNNGGVSAQVQYLADALGLEEARRIIQGLAVGPDEVES